MLKIDKSSRNKRNILSFETNFSLAIKFMKCKNNFSLWNFNGVSILFLTYSVICQKISIALANRVFLAASRSCEIGWRQRQICRQHNLSIIFVTFYIFRNNSFARNFYWSMIIAVNIMCLSSLFIYFHNKSYTFLLFISWINYNYNYNILTSNCVVKEKTCWTFYFVTGVVFFWPCRSPLLKNKTQAF